MKAIIIDDWGVPIGPFENGTIAAQWSIKQFGENAPEPTDLISPEEYVKIRNVA